MRPCTCDSTHLNNYRSRILNVLKLHESEMLTPEEMQRVYLDKQTSVRCSDLGPRRTSKSRDWNQASNALPYFNLRERSCLTRADFLSYANCIFFRLNLNRKVPNDRTKNDASLDISTSHTARSNKLGRKILVKVQLETMTLWFATSEMKSPSAPSTATPDGKCLRIRLGCWRTMPCPDRIVDTCLRCFLHPISLQIYLRKKRHVKTTFHLLRAGALVQLAHPTSSPLFEILSSLFSFFCFPMERSVILKSNTTTASPLADHRFPPSVSCLRNVSFGPLRNNMEGTMTWTEFDDIYLETLMQNFRVSEKKRQRGIILCEMRVSVNSVRKYEEPSVLLDVRKPSVFGKTNYQKYSIELRQILDFTLLANSVRRIRTNQESFWTAAQAPSPFHCRRPRPARPTSTKASLSPRSDYPGSRALSRRVRPRHGGAFTQAFAVCDAKQSSRKLHFTKPYLRK